MSTKIKTVNGITNSRQGMSFSYVIIRFTSDHRGETLSLSDESDTVMYTVAFEDVEKVIKEARNQGKEKRHEQNA